MRTLALSILPLALSAVSASAQFVAADRVQIPASGKLTITVPAGALCTANHAPRYTIGADVQGTTLTLQGVAGSWATYTCGMRPTPVVVAPPASTVPTPAYTTWYINPSGGTPSQCDGKTDGPFSIDGHCAYGDFRYLYNGETYPGLPKWRMAGGDTVIVRGAIKDGVTYRIGWPNQSSADTTAPDGKTWFYGIAGDPYSSGIPAPPSGTATQHTRILGENWASCHDPKSRTQLHGGYGVAAVLSLPGVSYIDVQCLDITDFSACGKQGQTNGCNTNAGTLDDYATNGIVIDNKAAHVTLTDVRVHGMAGTGLAGSPGDAFVGDHFDLVGNAAAGWNADANNGTTGVGATKITNYNISWNGCAEQYPIVAALPYQDCADEGVGGYGDGFGTATINSTVPWNVTFDTGTVAYNTQDGLDALHLVGAGSSMTIRNTIAHSNMGNQIKNGGANGTVDSNIITGDCDAMSKPIAGTPTGYNSRLGAFCRGANVAVALMTQKNSTTTFTNNTVNITVPAAVTLYRDADGVDATTKVVLTGNTFIGPGLVPSQIVYDLAGVLGNAGNVYQKNTYQDTAVAPAKAVTFP